MVKLMLNPNKLQNYAFFCPVSRLHLTVSDPIGQIEADRISSNILRGIRTKSLIDVDGVIDLNTGKVKGAASAVTNEKEKVEVKKSKTEVPAEPTTSVESIPSVEVPAETTVETTEESPAKETASASGSKKKAEKKTAETEKTK